MGVEREDEERVFDGVHDFAIGGVEGEEVISSFGPGSSVVGGTDPYAFSGSSRFRIVGNGPDLSFEGRQVDCVGWGGDDLKLVVVVVGDDDDMG